MQQEPSEKAIKFVVYIGEKITSPHVGLFTGYKTLQRQKLTSYLRIINCVSPVQTMKPRSNDQVATEKQHAFNSAELLLEMCLQS